MKYKSELPRNPRELNPRIPNALCQIILKCIQKSKDNRYQNVHELDDDLNAIEQDLLSTNEIKKSKKSIASKKVLVPLISALILVLAVLLFWPILQKSGIESLLQRKISIAILPFNDHSPEKELGYICEGIAETLIGGFSNVDQIIVRPSKSSFYFNTKKENIKEMGKKLNVDYLLGGSVMISNDKPQIKAFRYL